MRWFKHMADAQDDEMIMALEREMGLDGYALYFKTLELVSKNMREDPILKISLKTYANKLNISSRIARKFFTKCERITREYTTKKPLFEFEINGDTLIIRVPKLLKYRDEWTQRRSGLWKKNSGVTREQLPHTEVQRTENREQSIDKKDKEKKINKKKKGDIVEEIYQAYPRKVGKGAAIRAIEKALMLEDADILLKKVTEFAEGAYCRTAPSQYIPHPSTWFNQERWKDDPAEWQKPHGDSLPPKKDPEEELYNQFTAERRQKQK